MSQDEELLKKAIIMTKLLYMQTRPRIEELKTQLLKTPQQKKAYAALDGNRSIKEIAQIAGYADPRPLETMLPKWESKGLILSIGKGPNKKYINIENLEV
jgi:predicted HTH transcriptional regulator